MTLTLECVWPEQRREKQAMEDLKGVAESCQVSEQYSNKVSAVCENGKHGQCGGWCDGRRQEAGAGA